jgi:hypothetical protein
MKVILGVINDLDIDVVGESYIEKLTNLTDFWLFNAQLDLRKYDIQLDVLYFINEDELLRYGLNGGYDFIIGNWIGHLLRPAKNDKYHVIKDTVELCKNSDGLVGHIISYDNKIPYFYKEFWCVDVNKYIDLGSPKWESSDSFPDFDRSVENFHDNYTPYYLTPKTGISENIIQIKWGTGLIKCWLDNKLKVINFPKEIRELKHHLYPENHELLRKYFDSEIGVHDLEQPLQKQYFTSVDYGGAKTSIFLFNTDTMDFITPKVPIDNLISVCAAFRPYLILHRSGFHNNTKVKFIDYSDISLQFKKWLVDNWDGVDVFNAVNRFEKEIGKPMNWNKPFHETYQESHDKVINEFGGIELWLDFWNKYRKLNHEFHLIDLVDDFDKLENLIEENQNYIYFSNSYNTEAGLIKWGKTTLKKSLKKLVNLATKTNSIIDGSDVDHHYPNPNFVKEIINGLIIN